MKNCLKIIILLKLTMLMNATAQIKETGISDIELGKPISSYEGAVKFDQYPQKNSFYASPTANFYNIPLSYTVDSALQVKYIFVYVDDKGIIKRILLFIDDSGDFLIDTLKEKIGTEYTTGQTSIGRLHGYAAYAWSTSNENYILMMKDVNSDPILKFPVTKLEFTKRADIASLMDISFRVKSPHD